MSLSETWGNPEKTKIFVIETYNGLSEKEIRSRLVPLEINKVPGILDKHSILIIRAPDIPAIVICMMNAEDICLTAYMFL